MLVGYYKHSVACKFLVLKSDLLDCNTITETKNVEFFEHIYPLSNKISHIMKTLNAPSSPLEKIDEGLRRSKG